MATFIENLKANVDALEETELAEGTRLTDVPGWDSLALLSTMAMIASEYGVNVDGRDIVASKSVAELEKLVLSKR